MLKAVQGSQTFDSDQALQGSFSTREQCHSIRHSFWIEWENKGDCIRYYPFGLASGVNPVVMVYFGGDVMLRNAKGERFITGAYGVQSPESILGEMADWSQHGETPAIFVARPGIYGSSGDHNQRRHDREIHVMGQALDALKQKYSIASFILVGHSAGGQIVAAMLNQRNDLFAVVISSGLVSVGQVSAFWENRRQIPGRLLYEPAKFYDPIADIDQIPSKARTGIFILSDPEDRVVPFFSQLYYVRRLRGIGLKPEHIYLQASDPSRHLLAYHARLVAVLVAEGSSHEEIRRALLEFEFSERPP